jgi:mevalonate kinase
MEFVASAPCKAILFGEHYVVYGSPALAIAIGPRNSVKFSDGADDIVLRTVFGEGRILSGGAYSGPVELKPYSEVVKKIFGKGDVPNCTAEFTSGWNLKGVGASASFCAAFAAGLFRLAGKKPPAGAIFEAAQAGDLFAHGGRASGIDAKTVSFGLPLIFQRSFDPPAFKSKPSGFTLPSGSALLLIDTFKRKKDGTSAMLETFAREFGIIVPPQQASREAREAVMAEFAPLWEKINAALGGKSEKELGKLMSENHELLKKRGMSSVGIECAVSAAISSGAYGAKLTGGGGEGGAVLALCEKKGVEKAMKEISDETGFGCRVISLAKKGACVE